MRRPLKFVHTVATAVLVGALLLQLAIAYRYSGLADADPATVAARQLMADVARWATMPSMVLVVVSGLLLMAQYSHYGSASWAWAKALTGLLLVKCVITLVDPAARELARLVVPGGTRDAAAELAQFVRMERNGAWVALLLCLAAIAFGIWRPRLTPARAAPPPAREEPVPGLEGTLAAGDRER